MRFAIATIAFVLAAASLSCKKSGPLSPDTVRFRGQVSDPAGDASVETRVNPSPDLVSAHLAVDGENASIDLQFAPNRLDPTTSTAQVALDVDASTATGSYESDFGIGIDFLLNFVPDDGGTVKVFRHDGGPNTYSMVGVVPRTNVGNGWSASVPLAMLGGDDGQATFRVICSAMVGPRISAGILDYMPDTGTPPGVVR